MSTRPTIRDVAEVAGVSIATVSRFINQNGYVNDTTSQRIQEAIRVTGYTPNIVARGLKTQRTRLLLLVVADICNPFYSRIAQTLQELTQQAGYFLLLSDSKGNPEKEVAALDIATQMLVEGVLFATINDNEKVTSTLSHGHYQVIGINGFRIGAPFDVVAVHHSGGTNLAVEHLIELGHRRIMFAGGTPGTMIADSRRCGYIAAMRKHELPVDADGMIEIGFSQENGYVAGGHFAQMSEVPTAICCANDLIALGVIHALNDAGLQVPRDISVTGMDDIPYAKISSPPLTTVSNDSVLFAREAFSMLMERIQGKHELPPRRVEIPNVLLKRDSTGAPKQVL
ncbi:MAG: LacI family DNA-binding transcriptional regulator [Candidatus Excrementavichristensenella sp.]|jgi:LacI family repressor for deo operon, udp, cdd, tsx, nupC, and nupG